MPTGRNEDYLEAIYTIENRKNYAKVKDIQLILGVGAPSVTEMLKKLAKDGFVNYEKYSGVTLTKKGKRIAKETREKHAIIQSFLEILGVEEGVADEDACRIEHSVDDTTMEKLSAFVGFMGTKEGKVFLKYFNKYQEGGN